MDLLLSYDIVMLVSRKDKLALFLVIPAGAALTFILRHPSLSSPYILFAFQILVIPLIAYVSDTQRFLVWQVGVCGLTGSLLMGIMHAGGVTKREILPVGFVFWATGTILSSPAPIYWFLIRVEKSKRILVFIPIALCILALWLSVKQITR